MSGPVKTTIGVVVKVDHREQSIVSGGSGGGMVTTLPDGRVVGMQRPMVISTHTRSRDIIWIRTGAGSEKEFIVNDETFSCREGHKVGFVDDDSTIYLIHNFTTDRTVRYFNVASVKAAFAPVPLDSGVAIIVCIIFGFIGVCGVYLSLTDPYPNNRSDYHKLLWAFAVPAIIGIYLDRQRAAFHNREDQANQSAKQFFEHLTAIEEQLLAD